MNKNYKSEQTGRSMVEMLGVLAVIGVLSITGITGYTTAMNKHKANQILDAASKRAVAVSTQIQRGSTSPTLGEFDDNEVGGATFSDTVLNASGSPWGPTDTQFKIGFETEPSPEVLAQMQAIAGEGGIIQSLTGGLTYNNDLTTGSSDSDADATGSECTGTACGENATCQNGYCECESGVWVSTSATDSTFGTCVSPSSGTGCATNKDCNDGQEQGDQYCKYSSGVNCETGPSIKGTCTSAKVKGTDNPDYYELTVSADGIAGILSKETMDWWSAKNFCSAHGKHMVNLKESLVTKGSLGDFFKANGYCYDPNSEYKEGGDECTGGFSLDNYKDKGKLASTYWWTSELYDSCIAFIVGADGFVANYNRNLDGGYALCK